MPTFYSLASLAVALASISSALGSEIDITARAIDLTDSIMSTHQLSKRRVNHADAYGYPHGLPKFHNGTPMTPGGYVSQNPYPQNFGTKCTRDNECSSHVSLSKGVCDGGVCTFACLGDSVKQGNSCVGQFSEPSCRKSSTCKTWVKNATPVCEWNKCTFKCNWGYHAEGNKCVANQEKCGRHSCVPVEDGYNTCTIRHGRPHCTPGCATYLGYQLYTNADRTAYKCINTGNDPNNCGWYGNVCPQGYNGKGIPKCWKGKCTLDCRGWAQRRYLPNGQPYCSQI